MAFVCAISNEVPQIAVVSPVSGAVFDKCLIEKYIHDHGNKDPVNGEPLRMEQLIEIKVPLFVKPKPPTHTSIPGILKSLQDEWDAVMLHSFTLRQQLQTARQELSHSLYQHDAACRVIARLSGELTAARGALSLLKPEQKSQNESALLAKSNDAVIGMNEELLEKLRDTAQILTQERKRKAKIIPAHLAYSEQIAEYMCEGSYMGLHSASSPGILCLDVSNDLIVTGGSDKAVTIFRRTSEQIVASLKGHTKKVTKVVCHPVEELVVSGSLDTTARVWHIPTSQSIEVIRAHGGAITGLDFHPTGDYLLLSSMDKEWSFVDLRTGAIYAKVLGDEEHSLTSAKFHPDGLIFATGTSSANVKIWDLKDQQNVASFAGHDGPVTGIAFSENGYYLATAAEDGSVKLWDLRKLKNFKTIQMSAGFNITDVTFDGSGSYLALAGTDIRVYGSKSWNEIAVFSDHSEISTGIRFGPNADWIASSSMDRSVKIYSRYADHVSGFPNEGLETIDMKPMLTNLDFENPFSGN